MPLTKKGAKIKASMAATYGKKKAAQASRNAGKIKGVEKRGGKGK